MQQQAKQRGERKPYKLPIDIKMGGKDVKAGTEVKLFQDQIDRIDNAAKAAKQEG